MGQPKILPDTNKPEFEWIVPLADLPFAIDAARAEANRRVDGYAIDNERVSISDFQRFYRNLSMDQNTEMARNLHGTFYWLHNLGWNKLIQPKTSGKYLLNRLGANATALVTDYLLTKVPYGYAYQHEEFHRSVMSVRGIYSFDDVWKFQKGFDIAVSQVKDEDLIYLKQHHPADLVRLEAAGVEGEYAYFFRMREDNFFKNAGYPMLGLSILGTLHAVSYVNLPFAERFNDITDSIMAHDRDDILNRDFTGYDFSAWVYDLCLPHEPYEDRGTWPGGIGIRRPRKESDLTPEMKDFLRETGNMQYLNFITPFMVGINRIGWGEDFAFNFALRSLPTSFGYYAGADLFLQTSKNKLMASLGVNRSKHLVLPSLDLKFYEWKPFPVERLRLNAKLGAWIQPHDQMFHATRGSIGGSAGLFPTYRLNTWLSLRAGVEYKTAGWQFANPFLDRNFSFRFGLGMNT